jgi:UDP-GlcNAc3NAcA epimerase
MKLASIVGARPQFVKMAVVCHAVQQAPFKGLVEHSIIHTGQHYDHGMSTVFFAELDIPSPTMNLGVGSGSHGEQTGEMMKKLEPALADLRPDFVLLYGDTNSTLAGAVNCAKLGIPSAHIESGLRSFNRRMPEEINRVVADHLGDLLFCPTENAVRNLEVEGLGDRAILCGDIMYDANLLYRSRAEMQGGPLGERFAPKKFALATIHRAENTDDPFRLRSLLRALEEIAETNCEVVLPLHPRTRKTMENDGIELRNVTVIPPVSYLEMLLLEGRSRFIVTDSGGVQKEAYFAQVPCITVREETEWVETLENGCNTVVGANIEAILAAVTSSASAGPWLDLYGNGRSAEIMINTLATAHEARLPS